MLHGGIIPTHYVSISFHMYTNIAVLTHSAGILWHLFHTTLSPRRLQEPRSATTALRR